MSLLMPQHANRICAACFYTFGTTYPGAMDCPRCAEPLLDESAVWPNSICSSGHAGGMNGLGPCQECAALVRAKTPKNGTLTTKER